MSNSHNKRAFALIELVIVILILGIIATIAIPKFADLMQRSKQASSATIG